MLGAIAGDVIGSVHEYTGTKSTDFELFTERSEFTDDTVLAVAVADCLLHGLDFVFIVTIVSSWFMRRHLVRGLIRL